MVPHPSNLTIFLRPAQRPEHTAHPLHPQISVSQTSLEPALPAGRPGVIARVSRERDGRNQTDPHVYYSHMCLCDRWAAVSATQSGDRRSVRRRRQEPADLALNRVSDRLDDRHNTCRFSTLRKFYHLLSAQHQVPQRVLRYVLSAMAEEYGLEEQQSDDVSEQQLAANFAGRSWPESRSHLLTTQKGIHTLARNWLTCQRSEKR